MSLNNSAAALDDIQEDGLMDENLVNFVKEPHLVVLDRRPADQASHLSNTERCAIQVAGSLSISF